MSSNIPNIPSPPSSPVTVPPVVVPPVVVPPVVVPPVTVPPVIVPPVIVPPVTVPPVIVPPVTVPPVVVPPVTVPLVVVPPVVVPPVTVPPVTVPPVTEPPVVVPPVVVPLNVDISTNITVSSSSITSIAVDNSHIVDISAMMQLPQDASINSFTTSVSGGFEIIQETAVLPDGTIIYQQVGITIDPSSDIQITQDLSAIIRIYNDETDPSLNAIMQEITKYAANINCTNFQGKGSIDDYAELFTVASNLAKEAKQTTLVIDISGFYEFGNAADELSNVFQQYIVKLQNINVVNDMEFLKAITASLKKISHLADVFGKFKETILATSIVEIPKSLEDTRLIIDGVMSEVDCAMKYVQHFICPENDISMCAASSLSPEEKALIASAIATIQEWDNKYSKNLQGILSENADVKFIAEANQIIANTAKLLKNSTVVFKGKISILCKK